MTLSQPYLDARHATAIHLLINGVDLSELNGHVAKSLITRGFLSDRRPNDAARSWLSRYNGRVAAEKTVKRKPVTVKRAKAKAQAAVPSSVPPEAPVQAAQDVPADVPPSVSDKIRAVRARMVVDQIVNHPQHWLFVSRSAANNCDVDADALGVLAFLGVLRDKAGADISLSALANRFPELGKSGVRRAIAALHAAGFVIPLTE